LGGILDTKKERIGNTLLFFNYGNPLNEASKTKIKSERSEIIMEVVTHLMNTNPDSLLKSQNSFKNINQ
jgi:hypothetical protein